MHQHPSDITSDGIEIHGIFGPDTLMATQAPVFLSVPALTTENPAISATLSTLQFMTAHYQADTEQRWNTCLQLQSSGRPHSVPETAVRSLHACQDVTECLRLRVVNRASVAHHVPLLYVGCATVQRRHALR